MPPSTGASSGKFGRNEQAIAIHNNLLARFGTATALPLST
jgi:hypothetical protein